MIEDVTDMLARYAGCSHKGCGGTP
jgi:hypothetical protein